MMPLTEQVLAVPICDSLSWVDASNVQGGLGADVYQRLHKIKGLNSPVRRQRSGKKAHAPGHGVEAAAN